MRSGKGRWGTTQGKGGRWLAGEPTNRPMATQAGEPDSVGVGTITRLPSDSLPGSIAQIRGPGQVHEEEELLFADEGGPFAFNTEDIVSFKVGSRQGSRWASNLSLWQEHIDGRLPSGPASTAAAAASTATTAAAAPVVMAAAGAAAAAAAAIPPRTLHPQTPPRHHRRRHSHPGWPSCPWAPWQSCPHRRSEAAAA
mmetsp:Transcript_19077/g.41119  ORF Transcript_19077/g.41119 Transcript_19077/m.41119 type:complete len:197 (+) Transcript_19077:188-778(+)